MFVNVCERETTCPALYVHVPFCVQKCDYCGFFSEPLIFDRVPTYLAALAREVRSEVTSDLRAQFETIFIGGGNPTALGARWLDDLLQLIVSAVDLQRITEFTIESNPETLTPEVISVLQNIPNLRLSLGWQRLNDRELAWLGRRGTMIHHRASLDLAATITDRLSIDLILGLPGIPSIAPALARILPELPIRHVSSYFLGVEPKTLLAGRIDEGLVGDPDDVGPEEWFEVAAVLQTAGFRSYELSNFARQDHECQHNLHYWHGNDYLGLGPSAVGTRNSRRRHNPLSLSAWAAGEAPVIEDLSPVIRRNEWVMLRLRLREEGLDPNEYVTRFGSWPADLQAALHREIAAGRLMWTGQAYRLTDAGFVVANRVIASLFS